MSLPNSKIRCHGCNFEGVLAHRAVILRYQLPDGSHADSHRVTGWCSECAGIRDVEAPLDAMQIREELSQLRPKIGITGLFSRIIGSDARRNAEQIEQLSLLLEVAESRRSSPRCLKCGSAAIALLNFDDSGNSLNFVHICGSHLYRVPADPEGPRFAYLPEVIELDVEGCRL